MTEPEQPTTPPAPEPPPSPSEPPAAAAPPPIIKPRPRPGRPRGRRRVSAARRTDKPTLTPRMSFFITDDGAINFDRTTPETVEQLRKAITSPDAQRRLGLVNNAGAPTPPRTWGSMTSTLVDAVNSIAIQAAVNTWKLTKEQAQLLVLQRDPKTHEQVVVLTGDILDKYFPGGFGEYDKELSLLILLGGFTGKAVQEIQAMNANGPRTVVSNFDRAAAAE